MMQWSVVYKKAISDEGVLLFPERLSKEFLDQARRAMGSYLFANQYMNEVIPDDDRKFKLEWLRNYEKIPDNDNRFAFIDPAIGQKDHHDYTGIVVVSVDTDGNWYLRVANRYRITPTQIVEKMFQIQDEFRCKAIGIETVAYQESLLYILDEEMRKRQKIIPVKGIKRNAVSKESRILGLVPRFEWGKIRVAKGLTDFEDEYTLFPRASHDDLLDSLASLEEIVFYPQKEKVELKQPSSPSDPNYERWYIQHLAQKRASAQGESDNDHW